MVYTETTSIAPAGLIRFLEAVGHHLRSLALAQQPHA
jgi:hypothetical protein